MPEVKTSAIHSKVFETWGIIPVKDLGGRINRHWLVDYKGTQAVLRRYSTLYENIGYELEVLKRLKNAGWPVPAAEAEPITVDGHNWCLFTYLHGNLMERDVPGNALRRGRLLAKLHETLKGMNDLGARDGFPFCDAIVNDPGLHEAIDAYTRIRPQTGDMLGWYLNRAQDAFNGLDLSAASRIIIHSDFTAWNLLFRQDVLTGILDFEFTHLNYLAADFALAWRGCYDDVIKGYEEITPLSDIDKQLIVPCFWAWLFIGMQDEINSMIVGTTPVHGFEWQVKLFNRRSAEYGGLAEPYPDN